MLVERVTQAFWAIPALGAVLAAVTALVTVWLDRSYGGSGGLLYGGGPDSARAILQTVATSVLTFAGLAFSITIVALQLASSQFSPRVLTSLLRDRWTQSALGVFVGTFVYALADAREVRGGDQPFVPGLGVGLVVLLGLAAIGALVGFIQHMAQSLRVGTIIDRIFAQTKNALQAWYPDERPAGDDGRMVDGPRGGGSGRVATACSRGSTETAWSPTRGGGGRDRRAGGPGRDVGGRGAGAPGRARGRRARRRSSPGWWTSAASARRPATRRTASGSSSTSPSAHSHRA